jgi:hypothetical protein
MSVDKVLKATTSIQRFSVPLGKWIIALSGASSIYGSARKRKRDSPETKVLSKCTLNSKPFFFDVFGLGCAGNEMAL